MTWVCCAWRDGRIFASAYAPSTLGSYLGGSGRPCPAADAVASAPGRLAVRSRCWSGVQHEGQGGVVIDVDDTIVEVHGYASRVRGSATRRCAGERDAGHGDHSRRAPVIVAQRLRRGSCGSPRGAKRLIADAAAEVRRLLPGCRPLLRADWAATAAARSGLRSAAAATCRSPSAKTPQSRRRSLASLNRAGYRSSTPTRSSTSDRAAGCSALRSPRFLSRPLRPARWPSSCRAIDRASNSRSQPHRPRRAVGRLAVPRLLHHQQPGHRKCGQDHRGHAIIEQVDADLKNSALAHLPSGRHGQQRLASARGDGAQPHPGRRHADRHRPGQGHHRHHPQTADPCQPGSPARLDGHHAPAPDLALAAGGTRLSPGPADHQRPRPPDHPA